VRYCINCKWYQPYNNFVMNKFDHNCMVDYYKTEKSNPVLGNKHLYSEVADCTRKNMGNEDCPDYKKKWYLFWINPTKPKGEEVG